MIRRNGMRGGVGQNSQVQARGSQSMTRESQRVQAESQMKTSKSKGHVRVKGSIPKALRHIDTSSKGQIITYVLDTNVILEAFESIFNFKEHSTCIVSQVWSELDTHKVGYSDAAWNARKAGRLIEALVLGKTQQELAGGVPITHVEGFDIPPHCTGKIILDFSPPRKSGGVDCELDEHLPDNRIILACLARKARGDRVVLISNDVNCRVKARMCGVEAEEYLRDTVYRVQGEEDVRTGFHTMPPDFWSVLGKGELLANTPEKNSPPCQLVNDESLRDVHPNEFLVKGNELYRVVRKTARTRAEISRAIHEKKIWNVRPLNNEQSMALNLLMNPDIPAVSIAGLAGSGKTFLTLACALELTYNRGEYDRVIVTRPTIPSGDDIGFLPGDEGEKMDPWMGAIHDNIDILITSDGSGDGKVGARNARLITKEVVMRCVQIKALNFMKGRTLTRTFVIVDETQDLSPQQLKMIATRIGEGSKIVFLGNVAQIDNHRLTEHTCGMSIFIRAFADSPLVGHVTLQGGVRSPFATLAEERL